MEMKGDDNNLTGNVVGEPSSRDVLFGRGSGISRHVGNCQFRDLVKKQRILYATCPRSRKHRIAKEIVRSIRSQGGRFLSRKSQGWIDVGDSRALTKTSQALREGQRHVVCKMIAISSSFGSGSSSKSKSSYTSFGVDNEKQPEPTMDNTRNKRNSNTSPTLSLSLSTESSVFPSSMPLVNGNNPRNEKNSFTTEEAEETTELEETATWGSLEDEDGSIEEWDVSFDSMLEQMALNEELQNDDEAEDSEKDVWSECNDFVSVSSTPASVLPRIQAPNEQNVAAAAVAKESLPSRFDERIENLREFQRKAIASLKSQQGKKQERRRGRSKKSVKSCLRSSSSSSLPLPLPCAAHRNSI